MVSADATALTAPSGGYLIPAVRDRPADTTPLSHALPRHPFLGDETT